jgi:hypothetical protein
MSAKKPADRKLPAALVENAKKLKQRAREVRHARALAALDRFRAARDAVSHAWWEMGAALVELSSPATLEVLGRADLGALCDQDLDISLATAKRILAVMHRVSTDLADAVTLHRAEALIALADATPDDDTPASLYDATLTLPLSKRALVVKTASTEALLEAAKEFREAAGGGTRGLSASAAEKKLLRALEKAAAGDEALAAMRFKLIASRDPEGAWVEVRVRARDISSLAKLARAARGRSPDA